MMPRSRLLSIYQALTGAASPFASRLLRKRLAMGKEDGDRIYERLGNASLPRPDGVLIWLHGASVGEFLSLLPLAGVLLARGARLLVTTGTHTSARLAADRLPPGALHQFAPIDAPAAVRRFLDHWRPDLAVFAESEIWPNLMAFTLGRDIPLGIVNARLSERSFRRWQWLQGLVRPILSQLAFCAAQSEMDAVRLKALGATMATTGGNLKFSAPALPHDESEMIAFRELIGSRPVWLAASTHTGEEAIALACHGALARQFPDLLTIIVPRHPDRGRDVAAFAREQGWQVNLRSKTSTPDAKTEIFIADSLGELGLFYQVAPIAFIGNSLATPGGGHNPIEPAQLRSAIVHGPHVRNFSEVYAMLRAESAAIHVNDADALSAAIANLLKDPHACSAMADRASAVIDRHRDALETVVSTLDPLLERLGLGLVDLERR